MKLPPPPPKKKPITILALALNPGPSLKILGGQKVPYPCPDAGS